MSGNPADHASLSANAPLLRTQGLAEEFQAAWESGRRPVIEDYLHRVAGDDVRLLLSALLPCEIAYRVRHGETPQRQEYLARFPQYPDLVQAAVLDLTTVDQDGAEPLASRDTSSPSQPSPDRTSDTTPLAPIRAPERAANPMPERIGRYVVRRVLGKGGFGTVYLAFDEKLGRAVAIKVPRMERLHSREALATFLHEARTLASLKHPGIVTVHDVVQEEDVCYIVSEYVEGSNLCDYRQQKQLSYAAIAVLVGQVAEALHAAHLQGIVHRDVKPSNILLDSAGGPHVVDFGLAIHMDDLPSQRGRRAGTWKYMSPEQVRREGHRVDARTDIYSLGVLLYELLCGRPPFVGPAETELSEQIQYQEARPPRTIDDAIPSALERICLKAISKRMTDRYTTAKDMAEELRLAVEPGTAAPRATRETPRAPEPESTVTPVTPSASSALPVVPKGLRAFDAGDAEFFLQLLPGPRDRNGLPDSLRFWKTRIESLQLAETFPVGLLYGPSGCGKSSLVKAGLLPRLAPRVLPVYLEATAKGTDRRLLAAVQRLCPKLEGCADLVEAFRQVRRGGVLPTGRKLCVVVDQFEQWLHGRATAGGDLAPEDPLVAAMRQADGEHLQFLLMVREDFWVSISRVFQELEIALVEGQNSRLVDLFDLRHARRVLRLFGQAYDCLPQEPAELSAEQKAFLEQAVHGLSEQGRVVSVRLSLFADMMKGRPWTPRTLAEVGGIEGIGVAFLEETFSSRTAPPEHRLRQEAARAVLRHLLPMAGTEIRSKVCGREELLRASGYGERPAEFARLLEILDTELRIITPTEADIPGGGPGETTSTGVETPQPSGPYSQLTHDYLVPSLREWLNRKRRETRRGRAEMLLEERADEWSRTHRDQFLPSVCECLAIRLLTPSRARSPAQQQMLRRATWLHLSRLGAIAAVLLVGTLLLVWLMPPVPTPREVFTDSDRPPQARFEAFASLPWNDEAVFGPALYLLEKDPDAEFVVELMRRIADHLEGGGESTTRHREQFVACLGVLLGETAKPVEVRAAAFTTLCRAAKPLEVIQAIGTVTRGEPTADLCRPMVTYLKLQAEAVSQFEVAAPGSEPLRKAILEVSESWQRDAARPLRAEVFQVFVSLAQVPQVLQAISDELKQSTQGELAQAMLRYLDGLDLEAVPEGKRAEVIRRMVEFLKQEKNRELVACCLRRLDKYPPDVLCQWLMSAYEGRDIKVAAKESIGVYARACRDAGNESRVEQIGQSIENRLVGLLKISPGDGIWVFWDTEYLIQAIGQVQASSARPYDRALSLLTGVLEHRSDLEDMSVLDTVIESFVQLRLQAKDGSGLKPLREILADPKADVEARSRAADGLGVLGDLDGLPQLLAVAVNANAEQGIPNARVAAVKALGMLAVSPKARPAAIDGIRKTLRSLIDRKETPSSQQVDLVDAALVAFAEVAGPQDVVLLFPWTVDPHHNLTAIGATSTMIQKRPHDVPQTVVAFLEWRAEQTLPSRLLAPPEDALLNMQRYGFQVPQQTKRESRQAIIGTLKETARSHAEEQVRTLARKWLEELERLPEAPSATESPHKGL